MGRKILRYSGNIIVALCFIVIAFSTFSLIYSKIYPKSTPSILGFRPMNILSGSMRPLLQPGDMVITMGKETSKIKTGDIVTFRDSDGILVTHRVAAISSSAEGPVFTTRGDANNMDDLNPVTSGQIIGVMLFKIPYGGYISNFIKSPPGVIILVTILFVLLTANKTANILSRDNNNRTEADKPKDNMKIHIQR